MKSTTWSCLLQCWYTISLKRLFLRKPRRCSPVRLKSGRPVCPTYCIPQPGLVQVSKYTRLLVFQEISVLKSNENVLPLTVDLTVLYLVIQ